MQKRFLLYSPVLMVIAIYLMAGSSCKKDGGGCDPEGDASIITEDATDITDNSASISCNILLVPCDEEVTERGVCYDTSPNPEINDDQESSGSGTGEYSVTLSSLDPGTTYYARSYIITAGGSKYYGGEIDFTTPIGVFGQLHEGGIIFYLDDTGQHGLVAATSDQNPGTEWGCPGTEIFTTSKEVGTGQSNTIAIVSGCNTDGIAAEICHNFQSGGFSDWFLPSLFELNLMHKNLHLNGKGGFTDTNYWSSTGEGQDIAYYQDFSDGTLHSWFKDNSFRVRAVRAF